MPRLLRWKKARVQLIVVSEVLRRLVTKCLVEVAKSEATELFKVFLLEFWVSGEADAKIHFFSKIKYKRILCY